MCEAFAQSSLDFPHDFEQTGCAMEQEQMSKLVTDAAVPICHRHVSHCSMMTDLFTWGRQTSSAWDSFLSVCLGQLNFSDGKGLLLLLC